MRVFLEKPTTAEVMTSVPAIAPGDPPLKAIDSLKAHRVAVLVDASGKATSVLTMCDIGTLGARATEMSGKGSGTASDLFSTMNVYTVTTDSPVEEAAAEIAKRGLGTGIVVVDPSSGDYRGYAFNEAVRGRLSQVVSEARSQLIPTLEKLAFRA